MKYPSRSEYCGAIRNPKFAFRKKDPQTKMERDLDPNLVNGKSVEKVRPNGMKDLWSASGSFAIAFKYQTFSPRKVWAVRCFFRSNFDVANHYQNALTHLKKSPCRSYFVDFSFLQEGIRVQGTCYPILKMEWIEGDNIKKFIKTNLGNKNKLTSLAKSWTELCQKLPQAGIAHGDIQHGNILILDRSNKLAIKLIDYDSLYFSVDTKPALDNIKGLSDYQHPLRQSLATRCLEIDFFPELVIYLSILALAENKKLWKTYKVDDREGLLFSSADFQNPEQAQIFRELAKLPEPIPGLAYKLKEICKLKNFRHIPSLEVVLSDRQPQEWSQGTAITTLPEVNSSKPVNLIPLFLRRRRRQNRNIAPAQSNSNLSHNRRTAGKQSQANQKDGGAREEQNQQLNNDVAQGRWYEIWKWKPPLGKSRSQEKARSQDSEVNNAKPRETSNQESNNSPAKPVTWDPRPYKKRSKD